MYWKRLRWNFADFAALSHIAVLPNQDNTVHLESIQTITFECYGLIPKLILFFPSKFCTRHPIHNNLKRGCCFFFHQIWKKKINPIQNSKFKNSKLRNHMHLIIHRLYSTDALLATPSPVDQLSSRVSALRLGGCGFKPGHTKDSKNGTRSLLRVFGHGLGVLIKPFYSILKRPHWLPPNMAPKVHTKKKCFIQTTEFCFTWWNFFHSRMMQATVLIGTWMPQHFFLHSSVSWDNPALEVSLTSCLVCLLTHTDNKKKSVAPLFACIPGGHWESDFCM